MSAATCAETAAELVAFVAGELAEGERRPVAEHLAGCLVCRREMERLTTLHRWLEELPPIEPGTTFVADFERRLAAEPTPLATRRGGAPGLRWAIPVLAAAAVLALALRSFTTAPRTAPAPGAAPERVAAAPPAAAAKRAPAEVAAQPAASPDAPQVANVDALRPEDLPPELLEHPELFLRLPVVRRLDTLEHFGSLPERGGGGSDDGAG